MEGIQLKYLSYFTSKAEQVLPPATHSFNSQNLERHWALVESDWLLVVSTSWHNNGNANNGITIEMTCMNLLTHSLTKRKQGGNEHGLNSLTEIKTLFQIQDGCHGHELIKPQKCEAMWLETYFITITCFTVSSVIHTT